LLFLVILLGILAGIYPSMILTSVITVIILKGAKMKSGKGLFQNLLIIVQFGLAIGMIISTLESDSGELL